MQGMVSIDQVNDLLTDRLESLLPELIGGHKTRAEWVAAHARDGGLGDSLIVALRGTKRGRWFHHAAGVGGDPLGLICYVKFNNSDMGGALRWARQFLGGAIAPEGDAERQARAQRQAAAQRADEDAEKKQRARARWLFFTQAELDWRGTPAWHYLNNRLCGHLERLGHLPACIRFIPALRCAQLDRELPAMLAAVVRWDGTMMALHRTWLVKRGAGDETWDRLRESDAAQFGGTRDGAELRGKKVMGSWKGCAIHIWPGERQGKRGPSWGKAEAGETIVLAEGIETSLTLAICAREYRVACVVSSEGFASVILPPAIGRVVIAADRDPGNTMTAAALERAREAFSAVGRPVAIAHPPLPHDDWNSALKRLCTYKVA